MRPLPFCIVFSDLDGTLLDHYTYSFHEATDALNPLRKREFPLILCTSKTRSEIIRPFSVSMPKELSHRTLGSFRVVDLGLPYQGVLKRLKEIRGRVPFRINGFSDMTTQEVAALTGLDIEEASMAKERDDSKPILIEGDPWILAKDLEDAGLVLSRGGRFHHIMGKHDKGKAVRAVIDVYKQWKGETLTIAFGDSLNDLPMLKAVDIPVLVKKPDGGYEPEISLPNLILSDGVGPKGWNTNLLRILEGN